MISMLDIHSGRGEWIAFCNSRRIGITKCGQFKGKTRTLADRHKFS